MDLAEGSERNELHGKKARAVQPVVLPAFFWVTTFVSRPSMFQARSYFLLGEAEIMWTSQTTFAGLISSSA